jgi:hypothetical protein
MRAWRKRALVIVALAGLPWLISRASNLDDLQTRFDHESNSVHKAKLFEKLGDEQLAETRRASRASDFVTVGQLMEKYRDNAREALGALKKQHPDADHQLNGYKQLQMHMRKGLRDLKEILLLAPSDVKPPLELVEQDLASMDDELLRMLFPPRPGRKNPEPASGVSTGGTPAPRDSAPDPPTAKTPEKPEDKTEDRPGSKPDGPAPGTSAENTEEKSQMNIQNCLLAAVVTCGLAVSCAQLYAQQDQKDYLSPMESDKIRDAETTNARIILFVTYADDRLKKFQYELQHPSSNRHAELLNALMNGYSGCLDDAADLMQLGIEKQENIRQGVDLIAARAKEFLDALNKIAADKIDIDIYKDNLDDAIEGTRDAMNDAEKAKKAVAPPPVRRKN